MIIVPKNFGTLREIFSDSPPSQGGARGGLHFFSAAHCPPLNSVQFAVGSVLKNIGSAPAFAASKHRISSMTMATKIALMNHPVRFRS
jgi:hypothetical protein